MWKFMILLMGLALANAAEKISNQIVNKNIERSVDLTSQLVKMTAIITLENTGKDSVSNFLLVLEPGTEGNLSYVSAKQGKDELRVTKVSVEGHPDKNFIKVGLRQGLGAGQTANVIVEEVFTRMLSPYPQSIFQKEKQLVRYFGSHYFYTPYTTIKQTTTVIMNSRTVENYSKLKPVTQSDSTLTYGPYTAIKPFTLDEMMVHFENNAPFLTVSRLERTIEVSHWGTISVEENIEIFHNGAKLKGPFSRYDYQRDTASAHSVKAYRTILPASAHSIYYRDSNGNISTSTVKPRKEYIEVELRPRFPLFGGWKSSYTLGYSVPSYQYLYKNSAGDYVLNMRLIDHIFDDMHVEELETHIVLPVGASNVVVNPPYDVERLSDDVTYKYLDNSGRQVIRLKKTNLVEQHIQDIDVTYSWRSLLFLHEPCLIAAALYLLFIVVIIYVRLDFSLSKPEHSKKE